MASFSFGFFPSDQQEEHESTVDTIPMDDNNNAAAADDDTTSRSKRKRPPFVWLANVKQLLEERAEKLLVYSDIPVVLPTSSEDSANDDDPPSSIMSAQYEPIRCVDIESLSFTVNQQDGEETLPADGNQEQENLWKQTDLQPSVYEGGMKVWECSLDLLRYLAEQDLDAFLRKDGTFNVLELGCGHGLPGCYLLREALRRQNSSSSFPCPLSIVFSDFNDFVVKDATVSNIVLNAASVLPEGEVVASACPYIHVGYGDWLDMSEKLMSQNTAEDYLAHSSSLPKDGQFDLILAAETIYSDSAAKETALLLWRHLRPQTGIGLIATKRYYFGVGGGSDVFLSEAAHLGRDNTEQLQVKTVRVFDSGTGNIRELLEVRRI